MAGAFGFAGLFRLPRFVRQVADKMAEMARYRVDKSTYFNPYINEQFK